ncbi:MAG: L,D-transpeptidase [Candidatus Saccharibacteria bacterium]|nr:L,D-transpeptidase [Microbacteriaceae bacterium]
MERIANLRRAVAIAGATALLVVLAGCSAGMRDASALTVTSAPKPTATPSATPAATPSAAPVAAAPAPVAKTVAAPATPIASPCAGTPAGVKHIYVSIGEQHLWACTGDALLIDSAITTGASAITNARYTTPLGTSHITGKKRNTVLAGKDVNGPWNDPVEYWMPFDGGIGFHDSSWQTFPYGSPLYTTQGSHGCVHVPVAVIATIFDWAPVSTLVTVRS